MNGNQKLIIAIAAVIAATAGFASFNQSTSTPQDVLKYTQKFESWMAQHNKAYATPAEKLFRFAIFVKNIKQIEVEQNLHSHTLGATQFSDMTISEAKAKLGGYKFTAAPKKYTYINNVGVNPATVNWIDKNAVTGVMNVGNCGGDYAFSAVDSAEAALVLGAGKRPLVKLSRQQIIDCSTSFGNQGCNGGEMTWSYKYMMAKGLESAANYPFIGRHKGCSYDKSKAIYQIEDFVNVPPSNFKQLENAVAKTVVSVAVDLEHLMKYKNGIIKTGCGATLDAGVSIVGYGKEGNDNYWLVKNSWSTNWGESGYFRVLKNNVDGPGVCAIRLMASYAHVAGL